MKKILITLAVVIAGLVATSPGASALDSGYDGDTRRCVTHREAWIIGNGSLTRLQVETRWEVVNRGQQAYVPGLGNVWLYESCDRIDEWAFAQFRSNGTLSMVGFVR